MSKYLFGQGRVYIGVWYPGMTTSAFRFVGNCTTFGLSLGPAARHTAAPGSLLHVPGPTPRLEVTMESFDADNMALMLSGALQVLQGGARTFTFAAQKG